MRLSDLATLQSGIYAQPEPDGEVYYIQARHFDHSHQLVDGIIPELRAAGKIEKHFLCTGDLLVAAKGKDHFVAEYKEAIKPAVASSIFIVIRITTKTLLPSFLAWYLNLPSMQKLLSDAAEGTSLPVIRKADLESLDIPVPSLHKQSLILKIHELYHQEIKLKNQIQLLKRTQIQQEIINALSN
jgi:restriction endonuclease S subunit